MPSHPGDRRRLRRDAELRRAAHNSASVYRGCRTALLASPEPGSPGYPGSSQQRSGGSEHGPDVGQVLAAPEQFAVKHKARHAEYAGFLGGAADAGQFGASIARDTGGKTGCVGAGLRQYRGDYGWVFDIEFAPPEALEHSVLVCVPNRVTLPLGVEHADSGGGRIPDFLRPADYEAAFARLPPTIHVAVTHAPPLMRIAVFLDDAPFGIEPGRTEKARDVEHVRQPVEPDRKI